MSRIAKPEQPWHQLRLMEGQKELILVGRPSWMYLWVGDGKGNIITLNLSRRVRTALAKQLTRQPKRRSK